VIRLSEEVKKSNWAQWFVIVLLCASVLLNAFQYYENGQAFAQADHFQGVAKNASTTTAICVSNMNALMNWTGAFCSPRFTTPFNITRNLFEFYLNGSEVDSQDYNTSKYFADTYKYYFGLCDSYANATSKTAPSPQVQGNASARESNRTKEPLPNVQLRQDAQEVV
jgi:hypothetical protein